MNKTRRLPPRRYLAEIVDSKIDHRYLDPLQSIKGLFFDEVRWKGHGTLKCVTDTQSSLDCRSRASEEACGFYFRCYTKAGPSQSKKDFLFYIGHSSDFRNREQQYREKK
jgi:hypothetical protein